MPGTEGDADAALTERAGAELPEEVGKGDEYELNIDAQGESYNELRQKLMYFLVTSSVTIAAVAIKFYTGSVQGQRRYAATELRPHLLEAGVVAAVASAGAALLSVQFTHRSIARHLRNRYARKQFASLSAKEKCAWNWVNRAASVTLGTAFVALFIEVAGFAWFFYPVLSAK